MAARAYTVKALDETTWPDFAELAARDNGVFGGCWCMAFDGEDRVGWCQFGRPGLAGAVDLIAAPGGGTVEGYPEDAWSVPAGFLFNGALSTYEQLGFTRDRRIGKHRWVVQRVDPPEG